MTVPQGWSMDLWKAEDWTPETSWDLVWLQGTLMARSDATVVDIPHPPQHVSEVRLSFPEHMDDTLFNPNANASAEWNECLLDPLPSHAPFLEIKAFGGDVVSRDWHWSSSADAQAGDFAPVGAGGVRQAQGRDRRAPDEDQDQVEAEDREGVGEDMAVPIDAVRRDDRDPDASRGFVGAGGSGLYRDA